MQREKQNTLQSVEQLKASVRLHADALSRGVIGPGTAKSATTSSESLSQTNHKDELISLVEQLEQHNPCREPMHAHALLDGRWRLVYTSKALSARAKTKLGLRSFVSLGELEQLIDVAHNRATTVVHFHAPRISGELKLVCSFEVASPSRVHVRFVEYSLTPDALRDALEKQRDVLLHSFSPEGWLETTYLDDSLRIGRDDAGFLHVLERPEPAH